MTPRELDWLDDRYRHADARLRGELPWDEEEQDLLPYRPTATHLLLGGALAAIAILALVSFFAADGTRRFVTRR